MRARASPMDVLQRSGKECVVSYVPAHMAAMASATLREAPTPRASAARTSRLTIERVRRRGGSDLAVELVGFRAAVAACLPEVPAEPAELAEHQVDVINCNSERPYHTCRGSG